MENEILHKGFKCIFFNLAVELYYLKPPVVSCSHAQFETQEVAAILLGDQWSPTLFNNLTGVPKKVAGALTLSKQCFWLDITQL